MDDLDLVPDPDDRWGAGARLRGLAAWFDATPMEIVALLILLVGGGVLTAVVWWGARERPVAAPAATSAPVALASSEAAELTVHVAGAVARAGVVVLAAGSRVIDAVAAVGGADADADLSGLNLARTLTDGEQIVVPRQGEVLPPSTGVGGGEHRGPDGRLDLNRATAEELEELPGIGPVLAGRIVAWRESHGPFLEIGQLREVSGIGERVFQGLADLVAV